MPGPGLITGYLDALARELPSPVMEELADGLEETYRRHLSLGLAPDTAEEAAVAEFGDPELIAAEFARAHPARRAARRLLAVGPVVGLCWAVALITGRAWTWPVPVAAGIVPGLALVMVIALLAFATRCTRYRPVGRAGAAGCIGTAALDTFMIIGVLAADPAARWAMAVAMTASAAGLAFNMRLVRPVLAGSGLHDGAAALDQDDVTPAAVVLADALPGPTTRNPAARCRARLEVFSGKMPDWMVQILAHALLAQVIQPRVTQLRRLVLAEAGRFPDLDRLFYEHGPDAPSPRWPPPSSTSQPAGPCRRTTRRRRPSTSTAWSCQPR